tara:strand:- start:63 stop:260 length:198 start_codon:yes stop_codon:yes gene_type:complete
LSTETEAKTDETQADEPMFCKVEDVRTFMEQVVVAMLSIVNGINSTMDELSNSTNRSENSDDNED